MGERRSKEGALGIDEVSELLWRERRLLELLLFKLEEEQLLLAAGRTRWLDAATRELETVLEEIHAAEVGRGVVVSEVADAMGLGSDPSLRDLAAAAPGPWPDLLGRHRRALVELASEIEGVAEANHVLLEDDEAGSADLVARDAGGGVPDTVLQLQLQRVVREAAVGAAQAVQPSLVDFLR